MALLQACANSATSETCGSPRKKEKHLNNVEKYLLRLSKRRKKCMPQVRASMVDVSDTASDFQAELP